MLAVIRAIVRQLAAGLVPALDQDPATREVRAHLNMIERVTR